MKKRTLRFVIIILIVLLSALVYVFTYVPPLSQQHGTVNTKLYLGKSPNQPLVVAFGGGGGGNDWARDYMKDKRDSLLDNGYAVLAIGYFNCNGAPEHLDRISLNAIKDTIMKLANRPEIDRSRIALIGGSRGGELVLNLASRFYDFKAVVALSTSNVSFPALTWSSNTSSWMFNGKEVLYVPATSEVIIPALKGDLYTAHTIMLQDNEAAKKAEIAVENINGSILLMSGNNDEQWPSAAMSEKIMERLNQNNFAHRYEHLKLVGGHTEPLKHFGKVIEFLDNHLK